MMPIMQNVNTINYALSAAIGGVLIVMGHISVGAFHRF